MGELRLYLDSVIVDVVPRLGRVILFKSECIEHEVRPTRNYQRFALTTWFHQTIHLLQEPTLVESVKELKETIFIGIPAYRDPEVASTVKELIEKADNKLNLRIRIFL
jgi:hypothetical protein